jgi:hypothetical protein
VRGGLRAGTIAAAATGGVVAGFGVRDGSMAEPFAALGRLLLGIAATEGAGRQLAATAAGLFVHAAVATAWGALFALVAARLRGWRLVLAAGSFSAAAAIASTALPELLRLGYGARALPPQLALLYTVLALSLVAGMRLAFPGGRIGDAAPGRRVSGEGMEQ